MTMNSEASFGVCAAVAACRVACAAAYRGDLEPLVVETAGEVGRMRINSTARNLAVSDRGSVR